MVLDTFQNMVHILAQKKAATFVKEGRSPACFFLLGQGHYFNEDIKIHVNHKWYSIKEKNST